MKSVSAIQKTLRSVGLVGVALVLAVGAHVAPALADDTDPTFEPLVVNSIFKPKPTTEPLGVTSLREHEKSIEKGYAILLSLRSLPQGQVEEQCACGNFLDWKEFGRRQREAY